MRVLDTSESHPEWLVNVYEVFVQVNSSGDVTTEC